MRLHTLALQWIFSGILSLCPIWALQASGSSPRAEDKNGKPPAAPSIQKTDVLRQLSTAFEEISQRSGRAVVQIFAHGYSPLTDAEGGGELLTAENSSGSGIIMSPDGYILTNAHVVKGARTLKVQLNVRTAAERREQGDKEVDRALPATVVGIDRLTDLALIKIKKTNLPFLTFADSDELKQGELVLALGNPLGLDNSVSLGVVSAIARQIKPDDPMVYIQTDAPINPGNSGGPLVNADGRVVGINTFILTQSGGSEGIGFSIPSNIAAPVFSQLKTQGHIHRAQLGLAAQTITPEMAEGLNLENDHGVIVSDVEPDGPAAHGGVKVDDIILSLDGRRMYSVHQLEAKLYGQLPGKLVTLTVQRGADQLSLKVQTEEQSEGLDNLADAVDSVNSLVPELGIVGLDITKPVLQLLPDLRRPEGVVVAARKANVPYSGPALQVGDAIYSVNRHVISNVAQLKQTLGAMKPGQAAVLLIEREGHLLYVPLELD